MLTNRVLMTIKLNEIKVKEISTCPMLSTEISKRRLNQPPLRVKEAYHHGWRLRGWPRKEPHRPLKQTLAIWVGISKDLEARSMAQEGRCRFWVDMCPWPDRGSACLDVDQGKKRQVSRAWSPRRNLLSGKPLSWVFIKKQIYYAHVLPPNRLLS